MKLTAGARFGPYEIVSAIGAGGMGEVYRARDTQLRRDVAIKILPEIFATDPDRLARFEREARVLASLNHPNIATIHGIADADGVRGRVMELVEGETLADRIRRTSLPIAEALPIARQIAEALDAAHEKGIVHRDLKPGNIKITPDGVVKVLDFGLAKAVADESPADLSHSPTATFAGTRGGVILGTAAYMSPEQARGKPVDRRTDIWAFGCVLYEMLTGCAAFARETASDTIAAILDREPDWVSLPGATPQSITRLLHRCLDKDQKKRLRDIADARIDLDDTSTKSDQAGARTRHKTGRFSRTVQLVTPLVAIVAVAAWVIQRVGMERDAGGAIEVDFQRLTYDSGLTTTPALSPSGQLIAYASDRAGRGNLDIWVQQASGGVPLQLTDDPADDQAPDFSPDGNQVVFRSERNGGGVYVVATLGGDARLIVPDGRRPRFSPDGRLVAYWSGQFRGSPLSGTAAFVVPLAGGTPSRLVADFSLARDPIWSPDGRSLVVVGRRDLSAPLAESFDWWWVPLDGRAPVKTGLFENRLFLERTAAIDDALPGVWTSSGVLFSAVGNLWSVPISVDTGRATGAAVRLTTGPGQATSPTASRDGTIVFADVRRQRVVERVPLGESAVDRTVRLYSDNREVELRASTSADGSLIAVDQGFGSYREIWLRDVQRQRQQMLVRVESRWAVNPTLSPDGGRAVYTVINGAESDLGDGHVIEASGGVPRMLCSRCTLWGFLMDSRRVLAVLDDRRQIGVIDVRDGSTEALFLGTRLDRPHVSPDDRWITFREIEGTAAKVFVARLLPGQPQPRDRWVEIRQPTTTARPCGWSLDSRVAYLFLDTDGFRCIWGQRVDPTAGGPVGEVFPVHHFHGDFGGGPSTSFGNPVTPQGFLYETVDSTGDLWRLVRTPRIEP